MLRRALLILYASIILLFSIGTQKLIHYYIGVMADIIKQDEYKRMEPMEYHCNGMCTVEMSTKIFTFDAI